MSTGLLESFAAEVGDADPVVPVGGRTQWEVGGPPSPSAREVRPPAGVAAHEPSEMIVRVRAGTPVAELDAALGERGQMVPLDPLRPEAATVGGVLSVGHSGLRRLRWGPIRDYVLEVRFVSAEGRLVKAGGPVVKNVSGFDLCRLLVGSLGTLGILAEVVLRTQPRPPSARWFKAAGEHPDLLHRLHRPSSLLWDGISTWVLLEGQGGDVDAEARLLGEDFGEVAEPPTQPGRARLSLRPAEVSAAGKSQAPGSFLAELGVGLLHLAHPVEGPGDEPSTLDLNQRVKDRFDPSGRLNPGRAVG